MKTHMNLSGLAGICVATTLALVVSGCSESVARRDSMSSSFGNALATNTALQTVDPWPTYVENTRIKTDGTKASNAIESYRTPAPAESAETGATTAVAILPSS